jgi:inorganic pyrophosphatase
MEPKDDEQTWELLSNLFQAHPWHGLPVGPDAPQVVTAYVEIVPTDTVKYEIDKASGHLKVDRPQLFSNFCPTLYGFVPQTYCGDEVAAMVKDDPTVEGDGDPLDICILTEKTFSHGDFILQAIPLGGMRLIDRNQADDKIVAILKDDAAFGHCREIGDLPGAMVDRLKHYFLTYKRPPETERNPIEIRQIYGRAEAHEVIRRSQEDYRRKFPDLKQRFLKALRRG